ncbi:bacterioferritin [bacterium SM23_31]|nr:MAG: bacterioferritin [bacterium SM23_31]
MKGDKKVLEVLSEALAEELTAVNQYFLHAEIFESWGYGRLSANIKKISVEEMKHAEKLIERILFLDGQPDMTRYLQIKIGTKIPEMLKNDLDAEQNAVKLYNDAIKTAMAANDDGSAQLLRQLLKDEEEHFDWFDTQLEQIEQIGLEIYLTMWVEGEE